MKIWIVFSGEYEDRDVVAVFSSEDKAVAYIDMCVKENETKEWGDERYDYTCLDVDAIEVEPSKKRIFDVYRMSKDKQGVLNVSQTRAYDWYDHEYAKDKYFGDETFDCCVIASNLQEAVDVAISRIRLIEDEIEEQHGIGWRSIKGWK